MLASAQEMVETALTRIAELEVELEKSKENVAQQHSALTEKVKELSDENEELQKKVRT